MYEVLNKNIKIKIFIISVFVSIDYFLVIEKKASILTAILVVILILFSKFEIKDVDFIYKERLFRNSYVLLYLTTITLLTQNYLLNYEIIDWDISSYLVASNSVINGSLPYELQWESKGPLLFYVYGIIVKLVNGNFIYFKLINDLVLVAVSYLLYLSVKSNTKNTLSVISSTFFILLFSQPWAISAYSELYCLLFIAFAYYADLKINTRKYLLIGLCFAFSTLINQGSIIFIIPFVLKYLKEKNISNVVKLSVGFLLPYIIVISLFAYQDLLDIFIATYITIPLEYTSANYSNLYELRVFLRKFFEYNSYLYFALVIVLISIISSIKKITSSRIVSFDLTFIATSLAFYFIGSHNYYHHLLFLLYFISIFLKNITNQGIIFFATTFMILSLITLLTTKGNQSIDYLTDLDTVYEEYPLRELASDIDSYFTDEYDVLALEYNLVLHYLNKNNYSYIVHPTNFLEPYIIENLEEINYIEENYIKKLLADQPDVVICTEWMIVRGDPIKNPIVNCSRDVFNESYMEMETNKYFKENLNYYNDPYKKIKVFLKINN
jgi:hypothetical protein